MELIKKMIHQSIQKVEGRIFERRAARAIVLKGSDILLMYTKRYNDYSFPGGGVDTHEDLVSGLRRELSEETGATCAEVLRELGYIEEYRPYYHPDYDLMHMYSYYYFCAIEDQLGECRMENYEIHNGMKAVWINLHEAISHNRRVIEEKQGAMGFAVERETVVLELIAGL